MEQNESLKMYDEALDRLIAGKPRVIKKGTKISNNAVSIEAGRKAGSIKASRVVYDDLRARIEAAALEQARPKRESEVRRQRMSTKKEELEKKLDAALTRELNLVIELLGVRKQLAALTGEGVIPIRRGNSSPQNN